MTSKQNLLLHKAIKYILYNILNKYVHVFSEVVYFILQLPYNKYVKANTHFSPPVQTAIACCENDN